MTTSDRPRALVIGGSLGGLFAGALLQRTGWKVDVYERVREPLAGRGAGIVTHACQLRTLARCGVPIDASIGVEVTGRVAIARSGEVLAREPLKQILTAWSRFYHALMDVLPAERYHRGMLLEAVEQDSAGVTAQFANGTRARGDLLVAADGIRSTVRAQFLPDARPRYAGYVAWRGLTDERAISPAAHEVLFDYLAFCLAPREHILGYPVAGPTNSTAAGERCYNFVWYRPAAGDTEFKRLCTDATGHVHTPSIPPPLIRREVVEEARRAAEEHLCPQLAEVVRKSRDPFFQPIFDLESQRIVFGRVALLGDAAFVARPHCGAGVAKAAADAASLVDALDRHPSSIDMALAEYQTERVHFGRWLVDEARELGNYLESLNAPGAKRAGADRHHTPQAVIREIAVPVDGL